MHTFLPQQFRHCSLWPTGGPRVSTPLRLSLWKMVGGDRYNQKRNMNNAKPPQQRQKYFCQRLTLSTFFVVPKRNTVLLPLLPLLLLLKGRRNNQYTLIQSVTKRQELFPFFFVVVGKLLEKTVLQHAVLRLEKKNRQDQIYLLALLYQVLHCTTLYSTYKMEACTSSSLQL